MKSISKARTAVVAVMAAGAVALTGCGSSSGGGGVTTQQVENALAKSTDFSAIKGKIPTAKYDKALSCVAKVLQQHANSSDLKAFVDGKKSLDDVQGTDASGASAQAKQCVASLSSGS